MAPLCPQGGNAHCLCPSVQSDLEKGWHPERGRKQVSWWLVPHSGCKGLVDVSRVVFEQQGACLAGVRTCHGQRRGWADRKPGCAPGVVSTERGAHASPREGPRQTGGDSRSPPAGSALGGPVAHAALSLVQAGRGGHSSVEDAQATMELYKLVEVEWEEHLAQNPPDD